MTFKKLSEGKVREIYDAGDNRLLIVTSDRISAFDVIMPTPIPGKGIILNKMTEFWFSYLADTVRGHIISTDNGSLPAPFCGEEYAGRVMLVKRLHMLPFECIIRGYITGSAWSSYLRDGTICGERAEAGLSESQKFSAPLFTPSTKAETGHDENVSFAYMAGKLGLELASKVRSATTEVYTRAADYAASKGIIIADTKLEFGLDENGELVLGDEVLTPDSSRFWPADGYAIGRGQKSFDKQYLRDWLKANSFAGVSPAPELPPDVVSATRGKYAEAYERLTGKTI